MVILQYSYITNIKFSPSSLIVAVSIGQCHDQGMWTGLLVVHHKTGVLGACASSYPRGEQYPYLRVTGLLQAKGSPVTLVGHRARIHPVDESTSAGQSCVGRGRRRLACARSALGEWSRRCSEDCSSERYHSNSQYRHHFCSDIRVST